MTVQSFIEKIRQDKKLLIVILIGLIGAIMLVFTGSGSDKQSFADEQETTTAVSVTSTSDIETALEEKLISVISQIKGAGKTDAVVAVGSAGEYIYAENVKKESDSKSISEDSEIVIYEAQNGADSGLVVSIKSPEIIGVAIICEGGDSSVVKSEITKLVTSLFGIGSDRVYVGSKAIN